MRSIAAISAEIRSDWKDVTPEAKPYLEAMACIDRLTDRFELDTGRTIVAQFLINARRWKGDRAKRIKTELRDMLKDFYDGY